MNQSILKNLIAGLCLLMTCMVYGNSITVFSSKEIPSIQFAVGDLKKAIENDGSSCKLFSISELPANQKQTQFIVGTFQDKQLLEKLQAVGAKVPELMDAEEFVIRITKADNKLSVWAIGADATGAMYAGFELAETIAMHGISGIKETDSQPYIKKRGLKINVPLDARTPAYADCGDAAQQNMLVFWDIEFWKQHLDAMARDRYNTITMWNAHPFPSMVKVPDYPDVALEDVKIANIDWLEWFPRYAGAGGSRGVTTEILENLKTIKIMSMDEKIAFWQEVMQYAHNRGIEFHIITWNIFVWGADGLYGITHDVKNEVTIDYLRKSVRRLFETYPLLAGIGATAGERMPNLTPDEKEQWLWKTYGQGVLDAKKDFPDRKIRFIHRYWMSDIPDITKHFEGFDDDITFNFSYKYVKARLYANTNPTFVDPILKDTPLGTKWWWNLRNDDIFYFRWGDADYVREFIENLPPAEQTEGFYMGSDGYVWGREFVSTEPESPRQMELDKHWYKFMLWGRLGYNPHLSNEFFENAMQQQFPEKPTKELQEVWARASKIIPAVNREHWHDWDFQWAVEVCQGRDGYHAIADDCWKPGGTAVANEIQEHAGFVLEELNDLQKVEGDNTWKCTLGDIEAMAHLGNYYAEKFRAAEYKEKNLEKAIDHLEKAAGHWKKYAEIGKKQYKSQLLSKAGLADWDLGYENALKDISLLKELMNEQDMDEPED